MKTRSLVGSMLLGIAGCTSLYSFQSISSEPPTPCYSQILALQSARANHAASFTTELDIPSEALVRVRAAEQAYRDCSGVIPPGYPHNTLSTEECAAVQNDIKGQEPDYARNCLVSKPDWTLNERGSCILKKRSLDQLRQLFEGCRQ